VNFVGKNNEAFEHYQPEKTLELNYREESILARHRKDLAETYGYKVGLSTLGVFGHKIDLKREMIPYLDRPR
jgi:hypothetical protein